MFNRLQNLRNRRLAGFSGKIDAFGGSSLQTLENLSDGNVFDIQDLVLAMKMELAKHGIKQSGTCKTRPDLFACVYTQANMKGSFEVNITGKLEATELDSGEIDVDIWVNYKVRRAQGGSSIRKGYTYTIHLVSGSSARIESKLKRVAMQIAEDLEDAIEMSTPNKHL